MRITELARITTRVPPPRTGMQIDDSAIHRQFVRGDEIPAIARHAELHLLAAIVQLHLGMRDGFFAVDKHPYGAIATSCPQPLLLGIQPAEHRDVSSAEEILQEWFTEFQQQMFGGTIIGDSHSIIPHFVSFCQVFFLSHSFRAAETDGASRCEMIPPIGEAQVFCPATPSAAAQNAEIFVIGC